jgi:hypothetical protein
VLTFLLPFFSLSPSLATSGHLCSERLLLCITLLINLLETVLGALTLHPPPTPHKSLLLFLIYLYAHSFYSVAEYFNVNREWQTKLSQFIVPAIAACI